MADAILSDASASGIYQIRNLRNGKRYIGSAVCFRKRWAVHGSGFKNGNHPNRFLMRSWSEHGSDAFVFEIIETCAVEDLIQREQHWIDSACPEYNLSPTAGNCLGVRHSEETRRKRSELNRGNKFCVGRKPSAKCLAAVSAANRARKGYKRSPESVELTASAHRGMKRSAETRRRISEAMRGKKRAPRSEEHKANLSSALKGRRKNLRANSDDANSKQGVLSV
jgi:group I intron endonuclease